MKYGAACLSLLFLLLSRVPAADIEPESGIPSPWIPLLSPQPFGYGEAQFEQDEWYRKYSIQTGIGKILGSGFFIQDSFRLSLSPKTNEPLTSGNVSLWSGLFRPITPSLTSGLFVSLYSNGTRLNGLSNGSWESESDQQSLFLRNEYAPLPFLFARVETGIESDGNRSLDQNRRAFGFRYGLQGEVDADTAFFPDIGNYRLIAIAQGSEVPDFENRLQSLQAGGVTHLHDPEDSLVLAAGLLRQETHARHLVQSDLESRYLSGKLQKRLSKQIQSALLFELRQREMHYPGQPLNDKQENSTAGGGNALFFLDRFESRVQASYTHSSLINAFSKPAEEHPITNEALTTAERHLFDEEKGNLDLGYTLRYRYWRTFDVGFYRDMNMIRFDPSYSYTDAQGLQHINPGARDILRERDTFLISFPARDTGNLLFVRATLLENHLDATRSGTNHLSTTYKAGLIWLCRAKSLLTTEERLTLSVTEDSLFHTFGRATPHSYFRRQEISSFNDLDFIPFFRSKEDSVVINPLYALEEGGGLDYKGKERRFYKSEASGILGLSCRITRSFLSYWTAEAGIQYSRLVSFHLDDEKIGDSLTESEDKTWRRLFFIPTTFHHNYSSANREMMAGVSFDNGKWSGTLKAKHSLSRYNERVNSDYFYFNLAGGMRL
ncbi:MAG: hypothetical protein A2293_02385 [Elusimicrobia bacterium RIFOXYB2_FULL_49_7]|nr:MAG: hypothetical protein A2293_02385 [Elusimicrobia bacterium RIFOXYB2_FULL_49_7]